MCWLGANEGDEPEEEQTTGEIVDSVSTADPPLDLPLPSFSASFTQPPPAEYQEETMEIEEQAVVIFTNIYMCNFNSTI